MPPPIRIDVVSDDTSLEPTLRSPSTVVSAVPFPSSLAEGVSFEVDSGSDLALVEWDPLRAPLVGAVCARYRAAGRPVGALCESREDGPAAVLAGADVAVLPPYPVLELRAAVVAHRRLVVEQPSVNGGSGDGVFQVGPLRIDDRRKRVTLGGEVIPLTPRLYDLLVFLARRSGEVVSRDGLLAGVWGLDFDPSTNTVDVYVHYLRRALRPVGLDGAVVTVRGRGYVFEVP